MEKGDCEATTAFSTLCWISFNIFFREKSKIPTISVAQSEQ
jgi:hypothetical protein